MFYNKLPKKAVDALNRNYLEFEHLLKRHQKDFEKEETKYFYEANEIFFNFKNPHKKFIEKNRKYDYDNLFSYIEIKNDVMIIYYKEQIDHLSRIIFYELKTGNYYGYMARYWKLTDVMLMMDINHNLSMSWDTGWNKVYSFKQRLIDPKSVETLKSLDNYQYLPIEKFDKLNYWSILNLGEKEIYQYEILLKMNAVKVATALCLDRRLLDMKIFKKYKKELLKNRSLQFIDKLERQSQKKVEKLSKKEKIQKLSKLKRVKYDLGDYILYQPTNFEEWEEESRVLNHCLASQGTYLNRVLSKNGSILFLRKKETPNKPFYTVEIRNNEVVQVRTKNNQTDKNMIDLVTNFYNNTISKSRGRVTT